jgi:WD40 repeat protein
VEAAGTSSLVNTSSTTSFVVSASYDKTIRIWNIISGQEIHRIEIDTKNVYALTLWYMTSTSEPIIVACTEKSMVMWDTTYMTREVAPVPLDIRNAFELDLNMKPYFEEFEMDFEQDVKWSRLKSYAERYGYHQVFFENTLLFTDAICHGNFSFLDLFLHQVPEALYENVLPYFKEKIDSSTKKGNEKWDNFTQGSLVLCALLSDNAKIVKSVMKAWSHILQKSPRDSVIEQINFSSKYLIREELMMLASEYPTIFSQFITSLKLVEAHSMLGGDNLTFNLAAGEVHFKGSNAKNVSDLWKEEQEMMSRDGGQNGPPVIPLFIPLESPSDMEMLNTLVEVSENLGTVDLFNSDVGIYALKFAWYKFGRKIHIKMMLQFLAFSILFSIANLTFKEWTKVAEGEHLTISQLIFVGIAWINQAVILVAVILLIREEYLQYSSNSDSSVLDHFSDVWNCVDAFNYTCILIGVILRIVYMRESSASRTITSVSFISVWFKNLYFLRAFEATGPLGNIHLLYHNLDCSYCIYCY